MAIPSPMPLEDLCLYWLLNHSLSQLLVADGVGSVYVMDPSEAGINACLDYFHGYGGYSP